MKAEEIELTDINRKSSGVVSEEETLNLVLPDWSSLDTKRRSALPFPLWMVGDQSLLCHWLDYGVNQRFKAVKIFCVDRPGAIRAAMKSATLWPLQIHVTPLKMLESAPDDAVVVDRLPSQVGKDLVEPREGWELLDYWFKLENWWYREAFNCDEIPELDLAIGKHCNIDPSAELIMPCFLGDNVQVGPGCVLGPNVSIGSDSMLVGDNRIEHSKVAPGTFMGAKTDLNGCYLEGGLLINLRHRGVVPQLERFVADGWSRSGADYRPGWGERIAALGMWMWFSILLLFRRDRGEVTVMESFRGREFSTYSEGPIWQRRVKWLLEVVRGRCRLFGVLPRTTEQMESLDADWRDILSDAPVGVFSFADTLGCHSPDSEMEGVHAVYQAVRPRSELSPACRNLVWNLIRKPSLCLPH